MYHPVDPFQEEIAQLEYEFDRKRAALLERYFSLAFEQNPDQPLSELESNTSWLIEEYKKLDRQFLVEKGVIEAAWLGE